MKEVKTKFKRLERKISAARWFAEDWEIYNRGPYLQLYKSNWFNGSQGGIHFETFIEGSELKKKVFPYVSMRRRIVLAIVFIEQLLKIEETEFAVGRGIRLGDKATTSVKVLPLNFKNIEDKIFEELNRLSA